MIDVETIEKNAPNGAVEYRSNGFYYNSQGEYWCSINKCFFEPLNWNCFKKLWVKNNDQNNSW